MTTAGHLLSIQINKDTNVPYYKLKLKDGKEVTTTSEHIQQSSAKDAMDFPISQNDFIQQAKQLTIEDLNALMKSKPLTNLESEFLHWYSQLNHLHFDKMLKLIDTNQLPSKFKS